MTHTAYIGLGSNLGDRAENLRRALELLDQSQGVVVRRVSEAIETEPVGPPQPRYLNAAAALEIALAPEALLDCCQQIERALGRDRSREQRWGPRTIDLDILLIDDLQIQTDRLIVPHPRLAERLFVLRPLAEIAPDLRVPGTHRTVEQCRSELEDHR